MLEYSEFYHILICPNTCILEYIDSNQVNLFKIYTIQVGSHVFQDTQTNLAPSPPFYLVCHSFISPAFLVCDIHVIQTRFFSSIIETTLFLIIFDLKIFLISLILKNCQFEKKKNGLAHPNPRLLQGWTELNILRSYQMKDRPTLALQIS